MVNERSSRRSAFQDGRKIRLANGQMWTFVAPPSAEQWKHGSSADEFKGLMQAIMAAENDSERRLAELAFAIFLLNQNYCLSPTDYEQLLDYPAGSPESSDWERSLHQLVQDHLHCFGGRTEVSLEAEPVLSKQRRFSRLAARLRINLLFRWWSFDSRSG
jgi:hypothetical protein